MSLLSRCKILDGHPHYLILEDIPQDIDAYKAIEEAHFRFERRGYHSLSVILNEQQMTPELLEKMNADKYNKIGANVYYGLDLEQLSVNEPHFELKNLHVLSEDEFLESWAEARKQSLNVTESTEIHHLFEGLINELGPEYKTYCHVAFHDDYRIGVTIPHKEPGTDDEGRLFYLGILPEFRRKGFGQALHLDSLRILKKLLLKTYIGATGIHNTPMKKIFERNGCKRIEKRTTFRLVAK